jgi:hypothetical protein
MPTKTCHCGAIQPCPTHARTRGTTTQRGYGTPHQRRRAQLIPSAIGTVCPLCNEPMLAHQKLELDHTTPLAHDPNSIGDRIVHATCNASRAAHLLNHPCIQPLSHTCSDPAAAPGEKKLQAQVS